VRKILVWTFVFILIAAAVSADTCVVEGWVFLHNGSAVPVGTNVNITNLGTSEIRNIVTGVGDSNHYVRSFTCTQGADTFRVFSWYSLWNRTETKLATGLNVYINLTYDNIKPIWNATLPAQAMQEDNLTGIDNAFNLADYSFEYDSQPQTYSVLSQSNSSLVNATVDGSYIDISRTAGNGTGYSTVCVRSHDTEEYSLPACFNITVSPVADAPSFSSATDNFSGTYIAGGTTITITTTAFDADVELLRLYVCSTPAVTSGGCGGTLYCTATSFGNPTCSFSVETDEVFHSWYAYIYDSTNAIAPLNYTDNYTTDTLAPSPGAVILNNGDSYSSSSTLNLTWSGFADSMSGIRYYYYNTTNNAGTILGAQIANTTNSTSVTDGEGTVSYYVWAQDFVGHIGLAASDSIVVDSLPPVFSGWSHGPSDLTDRSNGSFSVNVTVSDTTLMGTPQYRYRVGSGSYSAWQDMGVLGGGVYNFSIPLGWQNYSDQYLYYEVNASDFFNRSTNLTNSELIDRVNTPPVFVGLTNQTGTEDSNLSITLVGFDPNVANNLTFTASCCFTITQVTTRISQAWFVPDNSYVGTNTVTFNVSDGTEIATQSITITVNPANDAPVLAEIGNMQAYIYEPFTAYFTATDPDNENSYLLDNNVLIFGELSNTSWFSVTSGYNSTGGYYYGLVNFTPLSSHTGYHFLTVYVTDGSEVDAENITLYVGYCGDVDAANEPRCDSDYESCTSCPTDCGECTTTDTGERMTILVEPRNCLNKNFTMRTYELWNRASCDMMGLIVGGYEVCNNLSGVAIKVFDLEAGEWNEMEEYETDDNGEATFVPTVAGEYKLVGTLRGYPNTIRYLEIRECLENETSETETVVPEQPSGQETKPQKEKPSKEPGTEEPETEEESSIWSLIRYYIVIPSLLVILVASGYYYYEKEKNNVVWLLKLRIWAIQRRKKAAVFFRHLWDKIRNYIGFGR
jgi:hypothetical protein